MFFKEFSKLGGSLGEFLHSPNRLLGRILGPDPELSFLLLMTVNLPMGLVIQAIGVTRIILVHLLKVTGQVTEPRAVATGRCVTQRSSMIKRAGRYRSRFCNSFNRKVPRLWMMNNDRRRRLFGIELKLFS